MDRLRAFRAYGHPLLLIAVWSTFQAATIAWSALAPGDLSYAPQAIFWTVILAVFLFVGSRIAWWLAIFSNTLGAVVGLAAGIYERGIGPLGLAVLQAASLWLIWSGNVELYVQSRRRMRKLTVAPPQH